jgi:hypothetical protein
VKAKQAKADGFTFLLKPHFETTILTLPTGGVGLLPCFL